MSDPTHPRRPTLPPPQPRILDEAEGAPPWWDGFCIALIALVTAVFLVCVAWNAVVAR